MLFQAQPVQARPGEDHGVEVYKGVRLADVTPQLNDYTAYLRPKEPEYAAIDQDVRRACMDQTLLEAADASGVATAEVEPAFPDGFTLGWAPPSPAQWTEGQRVYACTLTQVIASPLMYASVFTHGFPTQDRTCIDSAASMSSRCVSRPYMNGLSRSPMRSRAKP